MQNVRNTVLPGSVSTPSKSPTLNLSEKARRPSQSAREELEDDFELIDPNEDAIAGTARRPSIQDTLLGTLGLAKPAAAASATHDKSALPIENERPREGAPEFRVLATYGAPRVPLFSEKCHATEINDVRSDGQFFVTGGADSTVKVYSMRSRELLFNFISTGPSLSVDIVDSEWVISSCAAGRSECRIWGLQSGRQRTNFGGHNNKIMCARFAGFSFFDIIL
jgi:hypothetical protein